MKYSKRREYRVASVALLAAAILIPPLLAWTLGWQLLAFAAGLPFYGMLVFLTYARFRDASISSLWLIPMIFIFHLGPKWEIGAMAFYPSGLISFVPVVMGWMARQRISGTWRNEVGPPSR
jgi:hypothetical protein